MKQYGYTVGLANRASCQTIPAGGVTVPLIEGPAHSKAPDAFSSRAWGCYHS